MTRDLITVTYQTPKGDALNIGQATTATKVRSAQNEDLVIQYPPRHLSKLTIADGHTILLTRPAPNAFHRAMQRIFFGFKWEGL